MFQQPLRVVYAGHPTGLAAVRETLGHRAEIRHVPETREALAAAIADADVYFATLKVRLDAELIAAAVRLKLVVSATTGSDHVDKPALTARGIPFLCLKDDHEFLSQITPTAELAFLHILAAARRLRDAIAQPLAGEWDSQKVAGLTLHGRALGIIGMGRLGTWVSRYGLAFGMRVLGTDPAPRSWPENVERVSLQQLLAAADFVTLHVHLTEQTRGLIGRSEVALMKRGAVLVNTSRGAVVDESAVLEALNTGHLGAYGCDVLEGETEGQIADHPLVAFAREHRQVLITPHVGGVSSDAIRKTAAFTARKILAFFGMAA